MLVPKTAAPDLAHGAIRQMEVRQESQSPRDNSSFIRIWHRRG